MSRLALAVVTAVPLTLCVGAAILVKAFIHLIKQVSEAQEAIW